MGRAIEPLEREAARERQLSGKGTNDSGGRGNKKPSEKFSEGFNGRALDRVADAVGMSRPTRPCPPGANLVAYSSLLLW